jgi:hypothetical protein
MPLIDYIEKHRIDTIKGGDIVSKKFYEISYELSCIGIINGKKSKEMIEYIEETETELAHIFRRYSNLESMRIKLIGLCREIDTTVMEISDKKPFHFHLHIPKFF